MSAAEAVMVSEQARLDELAENNVDRTLEDGTPSFGQAASNIRLWEQRIREFETANRDLRAASNRTLLALESDIGHLAQRLSTLLDQVKEQITTQAQAGREQVEQPMAERHEAEQELIERERPENEEPERKKREQAARELTG